MKKRYIFEAIIGFLILAVFIVAYFGRLIPSSIKIEETRESEFALNMDPSLFYREGKYTCATYSVMAVLNIIYGSKRSAESVLSSTSWRLSDKKTYPQGVINILRMNGISIQEYVLNNRSEETKINWLKGELSKGNPIILMIMTEISQHYVVVVGYDEDGFMLYDSEQNASPDNSELTIVDTRCKSGNRYYTNKELIDMWSQGYADILFKNWAIVCKMESLR